MQFIRSRFASTGASGMGWPVKVPPRVMAGILGFGLTFGYLVLTAHIGFYLQDGGYLWYGVQRVLSGDIPLRDFDSYDPGRYYWCAAVMAIMHNYGMIALRIAIALFAAIGIGIANYLVFRKRERIRVWFFLAMNMTFIVWLFPTHKLFDITASIISLALLAFLLERPTRWRCFIGGLGVGVIAIIGRNHGLYAALADILALGIVARVEKKAALLPMLLSWAVGVFVGYAPMLLAILFVPGFWTWFWATIRVYFEAGETNIPSALPWPWTVDFGQPLTHVVRVILIGISLLALPAYGFIGTTYLAVRAVIQKVSAPPLLLASCVLSIFYTHHTYVHMLLPQAIYPMLIGIFAWLAELPVTTATVAAVSVSVLSLFIWWQKQVPYPMWHEGNWVRIKIGGDVIEDNPYIARRVDVFEALVDKYAPNGRPFMATPDLPGMYAVFDRKAPVWETYALFPADKSVQQSEIARLRAANPGFVIVVKGAIDNNPHLAFDRTNPMVYRYIRENYRHVEDAVLPSIWEWELYIPPSKASDRQRSTSAAVTAKSP